MPDPTMSDTLTTGLPPEDSLPRSLIHAFKTLLRTPSVKVGLILVLLLFMQIPLAMVNGLIEERAARQSEVLADFQRGWGPEQTVAGPALLVPYTWINNGGSKQDRHPDTEGRDHGWAVLGASHLRIDARLQPEQRRRGLFHATVYDAAVGMTGSFTIPPLSIREAPDARFDWANARVTMAATDLRGMPSDAAIQWDGKPVALTAADDNSCGTVELDAPTPFTTSPAAGTTIPFTAALTLRGTQAFWLTPNARDTQLQIESAWPTPNFGGTTLPLRYHAGPAGFDAQWALAGRPGSQVWQSNPPCNPSGPPLNRVGVTLQDAVPTYVLTDRASKYGALFLVMAYLTLFLFEIVSRVRIDLVQYGLVGLSISLFALLLISIAEPLGFTVSYAISAAAVLAQASLYTLSVVRRPRLAAVFAAVLGALFGFLYVVLSLDSFALLGGAIGLFVILSVIMVVTRKIEWAKPACRTLKRPSTRKTFVAET